MAMNLRNSNWLLLLLALSLPLRLMAAPYVQSGCDMFAGADQAPHHSQTADHECCEDSTSAPSANCDQCLIVCLLAGSAMLHGTQTLHTTVFSQIPLFCAFPTMHPYYNNTLFKPPRIS